MKLRQGKATREHPQPARSPAPAYPSLQQLAALDDEREALGITLVEIADEAAKTTRRRGGSCSIQTVSRVFHGGTKSQNVLDAYARVKTRKLAAA